MTTVTISTLNRQEHALAAIDREAFGEDNAWGNWGAFWRATNDRLICHVAECGRSLPVGFAIYRLDGMQCRLLRIAVDAPFRREGIGTQLIAFAARRGERAGRTRIVCVLDEHRTADLCFLRAAGFRESRLIRMDGNGPDLVEMGYRLGAGVVASGRVGA